MSTKTASPATLRPASVGSISSGTLRPEDLVERFTNELEGLCLLSGAYLSENHAERDRLQNVIGEAQDAWTEDGTELKPEVDADEILESLTQALDQFAPAYCYFGAHSGDGADFGFWPSWEAIDELPQAESDGEAESLHGEDCKTVTDHGNVTVWSGGKPVLELV